jgi:hypothetical protein
MKDILTYPVRLAFLLVFLLSFCQQEAVCQWDSLKAEIVRGVTFPEDPNPNTWFYNTAELELHAFEDGEWKFIAGGEWSELYACHNSIVIRAEDKYRLALGGSTELIDDIDVVFCTDSILGFWNSYMLYFMNSRFEILVVLAQISPCEWDMTETKLQGQSAFCLPQYFQHVMLFPCSELHTWGMLGGNGAWLIPPQYDGPFKFSNGTAEVALKGRRFKINERGE